MKIKLLLCLIVIISIFGCNQNLPKENDKLIYLKNSKLKIGVLTDVGGCLVFFGSLEGPNLLKSDTSLWNQSDSVHIKPSAFTDFKPYYGMITWVGPQSEWWKHQNINKERLKNAAVWPPDPFITLGQYQVVEKTGSTLKIVGPESPICGLQLTKEFKIEDNKLHIKVSAKNVSDSIVKWDLWSNARFDSKTKYMIPASEKGILRINADESPVKEKMDYILKDGVFNFVPKKISAGKNQQYGKAFIYPEVGNLLAIKDKYLLKISFEKVAMEKIHPEQALVEVFHSISNAGGDYLLELEHHSEFKTLKPGESFQLWETWSLLNQSDYPNQQNIKDLLYKVEVY
jgi:hypothetical protein